MLANSHRGAEERSLTFGGALTVTVADHDLDDLQIHLGPLFTLTGTAEFKGDVPRGSSRKGGLMLTTTDIQGSIVTFSRPDGTLRISNLIRGLIASRLSRPLRRLHTDLGAARGS